MRQLLQNRVESLNVEKDRLEYDRRIALKQLAAQLAVEQLAAEARARPVGAAGKSALDPNIAPWTPPAVFRSDAPLRPPVQGATLGAAPQPAARGTPALQEAQSAAGAASPESERPTVVRHLTQPVALRERNAGGDVMISTKKRALRLAQIKRELANAQQEREDMDMGDAGLAPLPEDVEILPTYCLACPYRGSNPGVANALLLACHMPLL